MLAGYYTKLPNAPAYGILIRNQKSKIQSQEPRREVGPLSLRAFQMWAASARRRTAGGIAKGSCLMRTMSTLCSLCIQSVPRQTAWNNVKKAIKFHIKTPVLGVLEICLFKWYRGSMAVSDSVNHACVKRVWYMIELQKILIQCVEDSWRRFKLTRSEWIWSTVSSVGTVVAVTKTTVIATMTSPHSHDLYES